MHRVKFLILFILWLFSVTAFFFLISPAWGEYIGLAIVVVYISLIYLFLDKWLLLFYLALPAQRGDKLLEKFQNIAYRHNERSIGFFYSRLLFGNVLAIEWAGRKVLILDKSFRDNPGAEESLNDVLISFKNGDIQKRKGLLFMYAVFNLPLVALNRFLGKYELYNVLSSAWLTPFHLLSESYELKKRENNFFEFSSSANSRVDNFTILLTKIISVYKVSSNDLVSMLFSEEGA